jgi:cell wall-associated NlpC family hydrolase
MSLPAKTRFGGLGGLCAVILLAQGCAGTAPRSNGADDQAIDLDSLGGQRAEVVVAALSQMGTPYVYGGTAPGQGLDCSGLVQHAHSVAGVQIPRRSTAQQAAARPVRGASPKPGDLVFFKTGPRQYHVGIMVDRDRFVHASTSKRRVRLASLGKDYWQQRFIGAGTYLH